MSSPLENIKNNLVSNLEELIEALNNSGNANSSNQNQPSKLPFTPTRASRVSGMKLGNRGIDEYQKNRGIAGYWFGAEKQMARYLDNQKEINRIEEEYEATLARIASQNLNEVEAEKELDKATKLREKGLTICYKRHNEINGALIDSNSKTRVWNENLDEVDKTLKLIGLDIKKNIQNLTNAFGIFDPLKKIFDIQSAVNRAMSNDKAFSSMAMNYSLTAKEGQRLKNAMQRTLRDVDLMGVSAEELVQSQSTYTDDLGRSQILSAEEAKQIGAISKGLGIGAQSAGKIASEMQLFGLSATSTYNVLNKMQMQSKRIGASMAATQKNFEVISKLAVTHIMKDGVDGMSRMASFAAKMKIDMGQIAAFAEKVATPEGAIETAASLQGLGGAFSSLADPIGMLNESLTDMEGLAHRTQNMVKDSFTFNERTHQVEFTGGAVDKLRLQQFAQATGQDFTKVAEQGRTAAMIGAALKSINLTNHHGLTQENKDYLASQAKWDENLKGFAVSVFDKASGTYKNKLIADITKETMKAIEPKNANIDDIAKNMQGVQDTLDNIAKHIQDIAGSFIFKVFDTAKDGVKHTANHFGAGYDIGNQTGGLTGISSMVKMGGAGSKIAAHMATKYGGEMAGKLAGKTLLKRIPVLGSIISFGSAFSRILEGDGIGSLIDLGSGLANLIPVIGTIASLGLDGLNMAHDMGGFANGGFTRPGGKFKPAGIVHAGEWVASQKLLNSPTVRPLIDMLDDIQKGIKTERLSNLNIKGYADGGYVAKPSSSETLSNTNKSSNKHSGEFKHNVNITGTIKLDAGKNSVSINASELLKDPIFIKELTAMLQNQINRDANGGSYAGNLNRYAMH